MADLISREAAIKEVKRMLIDCCGDLNGTLIGNDVKVVLNNIPSVDAVSRGVYEQIKWERDVAIEQLEEYGIAFGAKKQGNVIVLPCKVGDTVWVVFANGIRPYVVDRINIMAQNQIRVRMRFMVNETLYLTNDNFGKTVFLTPEEAEKALEGGKK